MSQPLKKLPKYETITPKRKYACFTIDYEMDHGDRLGTLNTIKNPDNIIKFIQFFKDLDIPLSAFISTRILLKHPKSFEIIKKIAVDYHSHSHTHATKKDRFDSVYEISESRKVFEGFFGYSPLGYRAPRGVLYKNDINILKDHGYKFDSSIFPSFRPGIFNNLNFPHTPTLYDNMIMEIPFGVIPIVRLILGISYMKLFGYTTYSSLMKLFGLPKVVVFYGHLHDYIPTESFNNLPLKIKLPYSINKRAGYKITKKFINFLKSSGYKIVTMTELYKELSTN